MSKSKKTAKKATFKQIKNKARIYKVGMTIENNESKIRARILAVITKEVLGFNETVIVLSNAWDARYREDLIEAAASIPSELRFGRELDANVTIVK